MTTRSQSPRVSASSFVDHECGFAPSLSIWIEAESAERQEDLVAALSDGGQVLMPLDNYGFSSRFGWVNDRYGVSWQFNLG